MPIPPNTELCILGVAVPFGETDLEMDGVVVEANKEETEEFDGRYGSVDIEDAIEGVSPVLVLGSLREGVLEGSGDSNGDALFVIRPKNIRLYDPLFLARSSTALVVSRYHAGRV